jgi:CRP-like cAMP-binding protein
MPQRDFFAFCAALKSAELRAIGELSWVRNLTQGEVLYSPGERGNALYIVNSGLLEVLPQRSSQKEGRVYLSRGDVVGEVEVFADLARLELVRAQEAANLQCFPRANFPELIRLVPSFFRYLCEKMAGRLLEAHDLMVEQSRCIELSGRFSNFDLTTIHQTIMSSGQTGELIIKDESAETIGAFHFDAGRLCAGQFQHLSGEEAFWQLFLTDTLYGTFSFSAGERPLTECIQSDEITRNGNDLLIVALQFRDEFHALKKEMPYSPAKLSARASELDWNGSAPEYLHSVATQVWDILSSRPATIDDLYRQCSVCELKLYQVVNHLLSSGQISFDSPPIASGITLGMPVPEVFAAV